MNEVNNEINSIYENAKDNFNQLCKRYRIIYDIVFILLIVTLFTNGFHSWLGEFEPFIYALSPLLILAWISSFNKPYFVEYKAPYYEKINNYLEEHGFQKQSTKLYKKDEEYYRLMMPKLVSLGKASPLTRTNLNDLEDDYYFFFYNNTWNETKPYLCEIDQKSLYIRKYKA